MWAFCVGVGDEGGWGRVRREIFFETLGAAQISILSSSSTVEFKIRSIRELISLFGFP